MDERAAASGDVPREVEFADALRGIWRSVTQTTRSMEHLPTLPAQQVDVLRRLANSEGMTPARLADALRLSRPTISELASRMEDDGLIERARAPHDGRSVLLQPTRSGLRILAAFDHGSHDAVAAGLRRLAPEERERLLGDLEALAHLERELAALAETAASESKTDPTENRSRAARHAVAGG